jgi:hypothetical protein
MLIKLDPKRLLKCFQESYNNPWAQFTPIRFFLLLLFSSELKIKKISKSLFEKKEEKLVWKEVEEEEYIEKKIKSDFEIDEFGLPLKSTNEVWSEKF